MLLEVFKLTRRQILLFRRTWFCDTFFQILLKGILLLILAVACTSRMLLEYCMFEFFIFFIDFVQTVDICLYSVSVCYLISF